MKKKPTAKREYFIIVVKQRLTLISICIGESAIVFYKCQKIPWLKLKTFFFLSKHTFPSRISSSYLKTDL